MKAFSFFKSLARLLFLNLLIKPLWIFGVDRQVQNIVGHEAYGTYFSLLNLSMVFSFVTDAGLSNMMNRQLASGVPYHVAQLVRIKFFLAAAYSVLVLTIAWVTGVQHWRILVLVIGIQVLLSFFSFFRSLITAYQLFQWDAWLSVVDKILMLALFLPLLYGQLFQIPITVLFFLEAQLVFIMIALCMAIGIIVRMRLLRTDAALLKGRMLLKSVTPYALILLTMAAHNRLDGFLLERLHHNGAYEAGVYAASYRLLDASNMLGYIVASFLVPFLARHRADKPLVQETVSTVRFGLLLFGIFTALFLVLFAAPVQQLLYPAATTYTVLVLQWCLPVLPAYLLLQVYGSVLTAMAQLKPFLVLLATSVLINILLNILLIPQWGAVGCCLAALVSQYFCAISVYFVATSKNTLQHNVRQWRSLGVGTLVLGGLFYAGRSYLHPVLAAGIGGSLVMLVLFAYLPRLKQTFSLSR